MPPVFVFVFALQRAPSRYLALFFCSSGSAQHQTTKRVVRLCPHFTSILVLAAAVVEEVAIFSGRIFPACSRRRMVFVEGEAYCVPTYPNGDDVDSGCFGSIALLMLYPFLSAIEGRNLFSIQYFATQSHYVCWYSVQRDAALIPIIDLTKRASDPPRHVRTRSVFPKFQHPKA